MNSNILFSLRNKQSCLFLNKESALKQSLERTLFLFRVSGIPFLVSEKGDIIFARPYGGKQGVRGFLWCVGEGLCPSRGRGNRRSAASGGCSEAISRKCPDWRPQQWPGIGWHDGGQENPAPMKLQGVRCKPGRVIRETDTYGSGTRRATQTKGGPAGRPYGFYIHFLYTLCGVLRRINLPGAGVYPCRPTRCGPRPGAFPGRWLFPPGRSRCGIRPGSPGPGL